MSEIWGPFWIVLTGALAGASCGLLGAYLVLRKMSLLGDALSHAVLPGIVIAFLLSGSRDVIPMFIGAAIFGVIATVLIDTFHRKWRVQEDTSIGIAFTALFALGVVLITAFAGQVDLDQECVLYGEIAYAPWDRLFWGERDLGPRPVWILGTVFVLNMAFVLVFYKELLIASFDAEMALSVGVSASLVHYVLMGAVSMTTVAAFEAVGAILVVAMLIVPGASAYLWSDRLKIILMLSVLMGVISAIAGYFFAGVWNSSIAGAMVVVMGMLFLLSLIFAPHYGLLGRFVRQVRLSVKVARDHVLLKLLRERESQRVSALSWGDLVDTAARWVSGIAIRSLIWQRLITRENGHFSLGERGVIHATRLLRNHRLWESYLNQLGLPPDHVHAPADALEHFTDDYLREEIRVALPNIAIDPQGKRIPEG